MPSFNDFGLSRPLSKALSAAGYETPTPIQTQAIPLVMEGHDLMGLAQTGTGKTAAFSLPLLDKLLLSTERAQPRGTRALVLAPTRELASQIAKSMMDYAKFTPLKIVTVVGGVPINKQARKLQHGIDILIATPGRLIDLENQNMVDLSDTRFLVLDEADQMLDMGFIHPLRQISKMLPRSRQTLMFSATMPKAIQQLSKTFLEAPKHVSVARESMPAEKIEQTALYVQGGEKQALLNLVIDQAPGERVIIFARTKRGADRMAKRLVGNGLEAVAIHGDKSQGQRERALKQFKSNQVNILVATDVAARGIDIPDVDHVINFDIPNVPEQYVHRIGRTARAGRSGRTTAFVAPPEVQDFRAIERLMGIKVERGALPDGLHNAAQEFAKEQIERKAAKPQGLRPRREGGASDDTRAPHKRKPRRSGKPGERRGGPAHEGRKTEGGKADGGQGAKAPYQKANGQKSVGNKSEGQKSYGRKSEGQKSDSRQSDSRKSDGRGSNGQRAHSRSADGQKPQGQKKHSHKKRNGRPPREQRAS